MPRQKKFYLPKAIREQAARMRIAGPEVVKELKIKFIAHLKRNGGAYYETCESFAKEIGWEQSQRSDYSRRIRGWMSKDKVFLTQVTTICDMANDELFEAAVARHLRRVSHGEDHIMVQNGRPVLSPRGMAMQAQMKADGKEDHEILLALADAHDQGQDVYVIRTEFPEQLTRQVLANYQPEVFAERIDPKRLSNEVLMRTLSAAMTAHNKEQSVLAEYSVAALEEGEGAEPEPD